MIHCVDCSLIIKWVRENLSHLATYLVHKGESTSYTISINLNKEIDKKCLESILFKDFSRIFPVFNKSLIAIGSPTQESANADIVLDLSNADIIIKNNKVVFSSHRNINTFPTLEFAKDKVLYCLKRVLSSLRAEGSLIDSVFFSSCDFNNKEYLYSVSVIFSDIYSAESFIYKVKDLNLFSKNISELNGIYKVTGYFYVAEE